MMNARERMLGRLRAAAPAPSPAGEAVALDGRIAAHYGRPETAGGMAGNMAGGMAGNTAGDTLGGSSDAAPAGALVDALENALRASRAEVWRAGADAWPALLAEQLARHGARRLLLDRAGAEGAALAGALPEGIEALPFKGPLEEWKSELFGTVDAGFTVARSGIAATGTLVLAPDAGTPRTVSLVPPLHVALVYADTLHATLFDAARAERWRDGMPSNLVLASGPSKTSDIQQTLAFGAHGPRWMWVVIVTERNKS